MISGDLTQITAPLRSIEADVGFYHEGLTWDNVSSFDRIQSITIDRVGANKFFGFGIGQKATLKLLDKDRDFILEEKDMSFNVAFNRYSTLPLFYVDNVVRDENTNTLTITAYDALNEASKHTVSELVLPDEYTLDDLVYMCAECIGIGDMQPLIPTNFVDFKYTDDANFDGTETIREVLDAIAEVTQTYYFISQYNSLVFTYFSNTLSSAHNIDKSQYFTLTNRNQVVLKSIAHITELGDNVEATDDAVENGVTQYIYNNPLLELKTNVAELMEQAIDNMGGVALQQFECLWRGNYLLELGDKITLTTKDDETIDAYLINDTITYDGGYKQKSQWIYDQEEKHHTNPTTLGEALKQTYAKVDKAKKQVDIVASETTANSAAVAALQLNTESINASVSSLEKQIDEVNGGVEELSKKVNMTMTDEEVNIAIETKLANGVGSVETSTGFTFNETGLTVSKSNTNITTTITENGMTVMKDNDDVLVANNEGVQAIDLHATTYLLIGKNSRFEDMPGNKRTACFWIGG